MSVLDQFKSNKTGSAKREWTQEEVRLVFGMKKLGATRAQISEVVGHSKHSVTYVQRRFKTDDELSDFTGYTTVEQYVEFAKAYLTEMADEQAAQDEADSEEDTELDTPAAFKSDDIEKTA